MKLCIIHKLMLVLDNIYPFELNSFVKKMNTQSFIWILNICESLSLYLSFLETDQNHLSQIKTHDF